MMGASKGCHVPHLAELQAACGVPKAVVSARGRGSSADCRQLLTVLKKERLIAHDCRPPIAHEIEDSGHWEAQLFSHAVRKTCEGAAEMVTKSANNEPNKLLFSVGKRGSGKGEFLYPRALAITPAGDICVADTMNHRIQVFSRMGLLKVAFGERGKGRGQFDRPAGIVVFSGGRYIAVADGGNRRVQVFTVDGRLKKAFATLAEPYAIACDDLDRLFVSSAERTIEVYDRRLNLLHHFPIDGRRASTNMSPVRFAIAENADVVVADISTGTVKRFDQRGTLLHEFKPQTSRSGLYSDPAAVAVSPRRQVIVADSLNHAVSLYDGKGSFLEELLGAADCRGAVQACAVSPEGHLAALQYTANSEHCLKVFRYVACECHVQPSS